MLERKRCVEIGDVVRMSDSVVLCYESIGRADLSTSAKNTYMIVVGRFFNKKTSLEMFKVLCPETNSVADLYEADIQRVIR